MCRSNVAKVAYLAHSFCSVSECVLIGTSDDDIPGARTASPSAAVASVEGGHTTACRLQVDLPLAELTDVPSMHGTCSKWRQSPRFRAAAHPASERARARGRAGDIADAPEVELPAGWTDQELVQLNYRTPDGQLLQLKALAVGSAVMLHWGRADERAVKSAEIEADDFLTNDANASAAYKRDKLAELVGKFERGLDSDIAVCSGLCMLLESRKAS